MRIISALLTCTISSRVALGWALSECNYNAGKHGCDKGKGGICYQLGDEAAGEWKCDCHKDSAAWYPSVLSQLRTEKRCMLCNW